MFKGNEREERYVVQINLVIALNYRHNASQCMAVTSCSGVCLEV